MNSPGGGGGGGREDQGTGIRHAVLIIDLAKLPLLDYCLPEKLLLKAYFPSLVATLPTLIGNRYISRW